jgi:hypothetical protein
MKLVVMDRVFAHQPLAGMGGVMVGIDGQHHQRPPRPSSREDVEEFDGHLVEPIGVINDDHQRHMAGQLGEQPCVPCHRRFCVTSLRESPLLLDRQPPATRTYPVGLLVLVADNVPAGDPLRNANAPSA